MTNDRFEEFSVVLRHIGQGRYSAELRELSLFGEGTGIEAAYEDLRSIYESQKAHADRVGVALPGPQKKLGLSYRERRDLRRLASKSAIVVVAVVAVAWIVLAKLDQSLGRHLAFDEKIARLITEDGRMSAVGLAVRARDRLNEMPEERKRLLKEALQDIADEATAILPEFEVRRGENTDQKNR